MTRPAEDVMDEEILEEYFEGLCKGDYESVQSLPINERMQVLVYAQAKNAQWLVELEQRMKQ